MRRFTFPKGCTLVATPAIDDLEAVVANPMVTATGSEPVTPAV
jgi:hypothetical protein